VSGGVGGGVGVDGDWFGGGCCCWGGGGGSSGGGHFLLIWGCWLGSGLVLIVVLGMDLDVGG
jgi:hypothetical protein